MRVLLLGSGAREHALAWKLGLSAGLTKLVCAPGNGGIARDFECLAVDLLDSQQVVAAAREQQSDLVVVGPEAPLVNGVADALRAAGIATFGPSRAAAMLEGSKAFAKEVMQAAKVPTARFELFDSLEAAAARALAWGAVVVKADGLAAGKGVVVANDGAEAQAAVRSLGQLPAGKTLLLEERLSGPELSVMVLTDGERFAMLPPSQDHKRLKDGDLGPNTGGMGAYAPAMLLSRAELDEVGRTIIAPTLTQMRRRGTPFSGVLYAGLMLTAQGPKVIEFNCRLGDPETQPLMMQTEDDLLELFAQCARGKLERSELRWRAGMSLGVVLAAPGYPEKVQTGAVIEGLATPPAAGVQRFHAGTAAQLGDLVTSGGRVLTVCAQAASFEEARALAYADVAKVRFEGMQFRRDIGAGFSGAQPERRG